MTRSASIRRLQASLQAARLRAIEELAAMAGRFPVNALEELAILQTVLTAVRDEIEAHEVKIGGGAEVPLK